MRQSLNSREACRRIPPAVMSHASALALSRLLAAAAPRPQIRPLRAHLSLRGWRPNSLLGGAASSCFRLLMSAADSSQMYYEDLAIGRTYRTTSVEVTAEEVKAFAARYDPQPFHLDPVAAEKSVFGGLVASGWMTAALTMRLMVTSEFKFGSGVVGLGVDTLQWPKPVRPGDRLAATMEITAMRTSESKPNYGIAKLRTTTTNQHGGIVQVMISTILIPRRPN